MRNAKCVGRNGGWGGTTYIAPQNLCVSRETIDIKVIILPSTYF